MGVGFRNATGKGQRKARKAWFKAWTARMACCKAFRVLAACLAVTVCLITWLAGCNVKEGGKIRDLDAVIVSEEALPSQLKEIIDSKKEAPFQFTYSDKENLYICIGYGKQETAGYGITLDELYLTETEVIVSTTLLGPDVKDQAKKTATYPFIVIKTELAEQPVVFK